MEGQSPLDRAIAAFLEHFGIRPDEPVPMVGGKPLPAREAYRLPMRAAILALREPGEAALQAGAGQLFGSASDDWNEDARKVWQAMVDAVLQED